MAKMDKISSPSSYRQRVVYPLVIMIFMVVFTFLFLPGFLGGEHSPFVKLIGLFFLVLTFAVVYFNLKNLVLNVMDEVYVSNDKIIVKRGGEEEVILFENVVNISYVNAMQPPKAEIHLQKECKFGKRIEFILLKEGLFKKNNDRLDLLIEEINKKRGMVNN